MLEVCGDIRFCTDKELSESVHVHLYVKDMCRSLSVWSVTEHARYVYLMGTQSIRTCPL
jgi:hypothetical protein